MTSAKGVNVQDTVKITSRCRLCGQPTHLWQDSSGSGWTHDTIKAETDCMTVQVSRNWTLEQSQAAESGTR